MKMTFKNFNLFYAALTLFVFNFPALSSMYQTMPFWCLLLVATILFWGLLLIQGLIFFPKTVKPLSILFILLNSISAYFIYSYHIVLNKMMLQNILDSNFIEATEWMGISFWIYLVLACILPIIFILKAKIVFEPFKHRIKYFLAGLLGLGVLISSVAIPNKGLIRVYLKANFNQRYMLLPSSYLSSALSLTALHFKSVNLVNPMETMTINRYWDQNKKNLIIFVLGESARDMNFPLDGQSKTTEPLNPYLNDMVIFHDTQACGVVTRVSVPCMFTFYDQQHYTESAAAYVPNALDIIKKSNWNLLWLDNEMGCNKVCRNIPTELTCHSRDCMDNTLNETLKSKIPSFDKDTFVVLHQRGSHGPRYDLRSPEQYMIYKPYCQRADFKSCSYEELKNAYNNSLHYTSVVLSELIKELSQHTDQFNPIVIYISDHGESLGEGGFYAHSADYRIAPIEQKMVPFFMWIPESTRTALHLDQNCLLQKAQIKRSQDNIFHTLMGLTGIKTNVYLSNLDLISDCIKQ